MPAETEKVDRKPQLLEQIDILDECVEGLDSSCIRLNDRLSCVLPESDLRPPVDDVPDEVVIERAHRVGE